MTTSTTKNIRVKDVLCEEHGQPLVYKFNEGALCDELRSYIDGTYHEHYSKSKFQATEFIMDGGHGEGFCVGNILKYAQRYGKKDGYNRKDLLKVLHYAIMALYVHDQERGKE